MDVTSKNFEEALKILKESLVEASFVTIDAEFTGISADQRVNLFDTPEERYRKLINIVKNYAVIQYGVCCFFHDNKQKYKYKAFNFYVFPQSLPSYGYDTIFSCQTSSLKFLAEHGFDFNKLFREGIRYLNAEDKDHIRAKAIERQNEKMKKNSSPKIKEKESMHIPEDQQIFVNNILKEVEGFMNAEEKSIQLLPCNGYQRKLLYETLKTKYPSGLEMETKLIDNDRCIVITKASPEEIQARLQLKHQTELKEVEDAVGFTSVIKLISKSGKLVVGHNMMQDLMHTVNRCIYYLPPDYNDFKEIMKCTFPQIIDTKVLASSELFKDCFTSTALSHLLNHLQTKPFKLPDIEPEKGFERYELSEKFEHEAGYDAFMTGLCLIGMIQFLNKLPIEKSFSDLAFLKPYINKSFFMTSTDIPYFNLEEEDSIPDRSHVFHVTFPREWSQTDLHNLFLSCGQIIISWLDDTSAFVALKDQKQSSKVVKELINRKNNIYKVRSYNNYRRHSGIFSRYNSLPQSDINLPVKRKRSIDSLEKLSSRRSIDTIPEEEEEEKSNSESSEPQVKKHKHDNDTEQKMSKLFDEDDNW